jgi:1-acyl-sn-glycerol-3-phosphate acyltransferase
MAIDRTNRDRALITMQAATDRLRSGISFGIFAEGTRAKPGEFLPFKKGAFYMAAQAGVPIVPVAIKNSDVLMGKGTGVAKTGTIEMVLLPVVNTMGSAADVEVQALIEIVQQAIAKELGVGKLARR